MWKKLQELIARKWELAEPEKFALESMVTEAKTLEAFQGMKDTEGWKVLDTKIREELQNAILEKIKDDPKIITLLNILTTVETRKAGEVLEESIRSILPE